jgi:hypothetical protein
MALRGEKKRSQNNLKSSSQNDYYNDDLMALRGEKKRSQNNLKSSSQNDDYYNDLMALRGEQHSSPINDKDASQKTRKTMKSKRGKSEYTDKGLNRGSEKIDINYCQHVDKNYLQCSRRPVQGSIYCSQHIRKYSGGKRKTKKFLKKSKK